MRNGIRICLLEECLQGVGFRSNVGRLPKDGNAHPSAEVDKVVKIQSGELGRLAERDATVLIELDRKYF